MDCKKVKMTKKVIEAIDDELDYQSTLQSLGRADTVDHGVEGQLVTLSVYTQEALAAWAKGSTDEASLDALRKVAAIAVRALVKYGCPKRKRPVLTPAVMPIKKQRKKV